MAPPKPTTIFFGEKMNIIKLVALGKKGIHPSEYPLHVGEDEEEVGVSEYKELISSDRVVGEAYDKALLYYKRYWDKKLEEAVYDDFYSGEERKARIDFCKGKLSMVMTKDSNYDVYGNLGKMRNVRVTKSTKIELNDDEI